VKLDSALLSLYDVETVSFREYAPWLLHAHYAHRIPAVEHSFGLFIDKVLSGVCTFGTGANINNNSIAGFKVLELNRLVVLDGLPRNSLSWFVSKCMWKLPQPSFLLSYADAAHGHVGYIYQATNWIYTGMSECKRVYVKDGKEFHRKSVYEMGFGCKQSAKDNGFEYVTGPGKHRYYFMVGSKSEIKKLKSIFPYRPNPYPKGGTVFNTTRTVIQTQPLLF
jgi:hypothetical protein